MWNDWNVSTLVGCTLLQSLYGPSTLNTPDLSHFGEYLEIQLQRPCPLKILLVGYAKRADAVRSISTCDKNKTTATKPPPHDKVPNAVTIAVPYVCGEDPLPPFTICAIFRKLLSLSVPQFSHHQNGHTTSLCLTVLMQE